MKFSFSQIIYNFGLKRIEKWKMRVGAESAAVGAWYAREDSININRKSSNLITGLSRRQFIQHKTCVVHFCSFPQFLSWHYVCIHGRVFIKNPSKLSTTYTFSLLLFYLFLLVLISCFPSQVFTANIFF